MKPQNSNISLEGYYITKLTADIVDIVATLEGNDRLVNALALVNVATAMVSYEPPQLQKLGKSLRNLAEEARKAAGVEIN